MKIGTVVCFIVYAMTSGTAWAQQSKPQPSPSPRQAEEETLELNTALMRSTFKLIGDGSIGTAFIIGRPSEKDPTRGASVLVTAAHVLEKATGNEATLVMRTKSKDGYVKALYPIRIREGGKPLWTRHPYADVAVMYVPVPPEADFGGLSASFLATDEILTELQIHPGDSLSCLGFPNGIEGNDSGFPILRSGKIASYPLFPTRVVKSFLFDINVFDGNSGGPVYLAETNRMLLPRSIRVGATQFIVGLVSEQIFASSDSTSQASRPKESLRLAVVIHASLIHDTIDRLPRKEE